MKAKHLTPAHIGQKITIEQESGLIITATLTYIGASDSDEGKVRLVFKELVDKDKKRIPQVLNYEDTVTPYPSRPMSQGGLIR